MKLSFNKCLLVVATSFLFFSCGKHQESKKIPAINVSYMDTSIKPSEDFFRYVNGKWLDKTEIPADRSRWGSFDELRKENDYDVLKIIADATGDESIDSKSDVSKAVELFKLARDTVARSKKGIEPIKKYIDKINAMTSYKDLQKLLSEEDAYVSLGFIGIGIYADAKDSNKNVVYLFQPSLGLPDREYYVSDSDDNKEKRKLYTEFTSNVLNKYFGQDKQTSEINAKKFLALETKMATSMLDRVARRDRRNTYHPMTFSEAQKLMPSFDLASYIEEIGLPKLDSIVVTQPNYIKTFEDIITTTSIDDMKIYLKLKLLEDTASYLSPEIEKTYWDFYGKTLSGAPKQRPINERALGKVNRYLGEALGKLYVKSKFPPEAKTKAEEMVSYLFKAYEKRIRELPWMTDSTKQKALEKLKKIRVKIGYPDKWKDYSEMNIKSEKDGGSYFENIEAARLWHQKDILSQYGKPVDKERWGMTPQTVNAYYNPTNNEIVFPAAILQPPFYNYTADEAINFGGIGAVIGHEISHGFDDSGARYDADGNLNNWWTEDDLKKFSSLGDSLAKQYSAVEPLPGAFIDGKFTLGENIGDLGGVNSAVEAIKMYIEDKGAQPPIDGFTQLQRFFISWATIWRTKARDEALRKQLKTDPHSPGKYRAYIPLQNVDDFYEAFDVKPSDKMFIDPKQRVKIW